MMNESTTPPTSDYTPPEYVEPEPVTAFVNWVLGKPFKDSIAKLDTTGVIAYINQIINNSNPVRQDAKSFWEGYKAGLLGADKATDDEIFVIGYDAALGKIKPLPPKRKPKNLVREL